MQLEALINQHYDQLNENDKTVARQILACQQDYRQLSCEKIAEACHISRATLLRWCRKIGLSAFSDLKYLLKESAIDPKVQSDDFHNICLNYQILIKELKKIPFQPICEVVFKAKTIYVYGTGNEQKSLAQELKRIFLSVGKCVIELFDAGEIEFMKKAFDPEDLFIIISLSGETKEGIEIVKNIKGNIRTLSMTRLDNNTISTLCQNNLYVATQKLAAVQNTDYEVVGVFYALLDLLFINFNEYRMRKNEN